MGAVPALTALLAVSGASAAPAAVGTTNTTVTSDNGWSTFICDPSNPHWYCGPATASAKVGLILGIALVAWLLALRLIHRMIRRGVVGLPMPLRLIRGRARELLEETNPLAGERREQRIRTIGSVLRSVATIFIWTVALVMVLSAIGLNIAPVLTGAGIVGVALGFGAQNLVKDFLSGVFMILEDQYGVGDVVDAGPASGVVEAVTLRITRLRDIQGTVWYVRNGEILRIGNMSQGWARCVIDMSVPYDSDAQHVFDALSRAAAEVQADERYAGLVIDTPEVVGIERFEDSAVVVRLMVKVLPLKQWEVSRALRKRIKEVFGSEGITIPFPQQDVWLRSDAVPSQPSGEEPAGTTKDGGSGNATAPAGRR